MIGERITERLKNYIKSMLKNVQGQYNLKFSDLDRLFAEVIFSVTQEQQWQGITNPHHRVNIIAKLLKQRQWKTPKGFYNHWDVGHYFRKKDSKKMEIEQQMKLEESKKSSEFFGNSLEDETAMQARFEGRRNDEYRFSVVEKQKINIEQKRMENELRELDTSIHSEQSYLRQLEGWLEQKKPSVSQALVDSVAIKIGENITDIAMVKYLMETNNLYQKDLAFIFGSQANVSKFLNGERKLGKNHIAELKRKFKISADFFLR